MLISDCSSDVCSSDRTAIGLHREHQAAAHGIAVDDDRACAADAVLATDMHASAAGIAAQEVAERQAAFDGRIVLSAVDDEVDWVLAHTAAFITMNILKISSVALPARLPSLRGVRASRWDEAIQRQDRKSTRLNSSH